MDKLIHFKGVTCKVENRKESLEGENCIKTGRRGREGGRRGRGGGLSGGDGLRGSCRKIRTNWIEGREEKRDEEN